MKKFNSLFVTYLLLIGCGGADSANKDSLINGKWESSQCFRLDLPFTEYNSFKNVMEVNDGSISNKLYQYTDNDCLNFGEEINNGLFAKLYVSYTVGESNVTENSENARNVDFVNDRGDTLPEIYLLDNSGKTLYFGKKDEDNMVQCPSDEDEPFPGPPGCWTIRPTTIDYNVYYSRIDE